MKKIELAFNEEIIAVEPRYANGPGWANAPLYIHIVDRANSKHRSIAIQPEEQSMKIHTLFKIAEAVNSAMMIEIQPHVKREKE